MKKLFLLLFLTLFPSIALAVAYNSNGTGGGNWSVAASWAPVGVPGAADTVTILAGDTITIDGNIAVGNSPVNDTTYNIDISGNLIWPQSPAGNWTFSPSSTILLNGTGKFYIGCSPGSPADRLNCANTAIVEFQTGLGVKYDIRIDGASAQLIARGCEGYPANAAGTETRARITACAPDCNAGINRTLTLDTAVNWAATVSGNPATVSSNPEVVIGGGGSLTFPGWLAANFTAEIAEIDLYPAANQVRVVNLAKNHVIGDMIANPTRNILFTSSSPANHSSIYSDPPSGQTLKPFMMSWVRLDEMSDGSTDLTAAIGIDLNAATDNFGTIEYTWATNCEDGGPASVTCFYIVEGDFDSFDWNGVHDPYTSGYGVNMLSTAEGKTVTGFTAIDIGGVGIPQGYGWQSSVGQRNLIMDQMWVSNANVGYAGSAQAITNSVFHHFYNSAVIIYVGYTWERHKYLLFEDNEIRNVRVHGAQLASTNMRIIDNDFDNIDDNCIYAIAGPGPAVDWYSEGNTFDHCNMDATLTSEAAIYFNFVHGNVYSQNDDFGSTTLNEKANILFLTNRGSANTTYMRAIFNNPILNGPNNPTWAYPIGMRLWESDWTYQYAWGPNSYVTIHNEDQVEGSHWGFGPGGMIIERVTGAGPTGGWINNTINLKVIPFAADRYCRIPLGKVHVNSGETLTIDLQIQKNQAIANGRRPRLVLKGSGFDPAVAYDEMTDVNNVWNAVQVSGVTTYKGVVHIYVEVLNDLEPAPVATYVSVEPVDPPTIIVYVDGISYTKN